MAGFFAVLKQGRDAGRVFVFILVAVWGVSAAGTAWGGSIKGSVRYVGPPVKKKRLKVTIDDYICGKSKDAKGLILSPQGGIRNAVVSLRIPPGMEPRAQMKVSAPISPAVELDQKKCVFLPHVIVVPVGGTLKILNSDRLLHNVHSRSKTNRTFNRAQPRGRTISVKFGKPEIIRLVCDLHSWMQSWIVVAEHAYYAVTDSRGNFRLDGVPPGKYTLRVWQESLGNMTREVTVTEKGSLTVALEMGKK